MFISRILLAGRSVQLVSYRELIRFKESSLQISQGLLREGHAPMSVSQNHKYRIQARWERSATRERLNLKMDIGSAERQLDSSVRRSTRIRIYSPSSVSSESFAQTCAVGERSNHRTNRVPLGEVEQD